MKTRYFMIMLVALVIVFAAESDAAGLGRAIVRGGRRSVARSLKRPIYRARIFDLKRDRGSRLRVLKQGRLVDRYTIASRASKELKSGVRPFRHMTSISTKRPLSAANAQRRLGLSLKPNVVERIRLQKGARLHFNKVVGGKPGYGEITLPSSVPPSSVKKVLRLRP